VHGFFVQDGQKTFPKDPVVGENRPFSGPMGRVKIPAVCTKTLFKRGQTLLDPTGPGQAGHGRTGTDAADYGLLQIQRSRSHLPESGLPHTPTTATGEDHAVEPHASPLPVITAKPAKGLTTANPADRPAGKSGRRPAG